MKIINTLFEKLKIRPVDVRDLKFDLMVEKIADSDMKKMNIKDVMDGDILVTKDGRVWVKVDAEHAKLFFHHGLGLNYGVFIRPSGDMSNRRKLTYMSLESYEDTFPRYYYENRLYDIIEVYTTNIDISEFESQEKFIEFFNKNKIDRIR